MQVLDSPDTVSEDAMCLKRDLPDVFYLNRRCEIIATSCSPIAGIAKTALVLDDQIVSTIRLEMLASAKDREPMTQQFACDGKFVRVLELDGEAGLIVLVERLRNRAGLEEIVRKFALSARELQVLKLIVRATSRVHIAEMLEISETTVQSHIVNIGLKMHCSRREEIIARALGNF